MKKPTPVGRRTKGAKAEERRLEPVCKWLGQIRPAFDGHRNKPAKTVMSVIGKK